MPEAPKAKSGSFAALAQSYFASPADKGMQRSTKDVYRNAIDRWCKSKDSNGIEVGTLGAATLRRGHVVTMMKAKRDKPESANLVRKVLRAMMQHAIGSLVFDDAMQRKPTLAEPLILRRTSVSGRRMNKSAGQPWKGSTIRETSQSRP